MGDPTYREYMAEHIRHTIRLARALNVDPQAWPLDELVEMACARLKGKKTSELDHWFVIRKDSHDRFAEFSSYDDALDFATELHATTGVTVMAMTGHNVPDDEEPR